MSEKLLSLIFIITGTDYYNHWKQLLHTLPDVAVCDATPVEGCTTAGYTNNTSITGI